MDLQLDAGILKNHVARKDRAVQFKLSLQSSSDPCRLKRIKSTRSRSITLVDRYAWAHATYP